MKRIVIDARESGTSTGRYIDKLLEYLHQLHLPYYIVVLAKTQRLEYLKNIAPTFEIVETPFKEFTFGEQFSFKRQIKKLRADLVFFPMVQQPVWYKGKVVTCMQDLTTIRFRNPSKNWLVFTVKRWVYIWVNKRVARKSDALITPTDFVRQDVAQYTHVDPNKITVTYEAADFISEPAMPAPMLENKKYIMYLGRPLPHKNLWRLVEAFQILKQQFPDLHLVLVGKKDVLYERIEQRAINADISGVIFTGFISDPEMKWTYQHCEAYIFPSLSEGFGLPALEAMMHGAPVVSSNATCLPEVYGDAAHYFNPLEPADIAAKISEVLRNSKLKQSLITKGKVRAESYSWKRMAEQTLGVFKKVLDKD